MMIFSSCSELSLTFVEIKIITLQITVTLDFHKKRTNPFYILNPNLWSVPAGGWDE